MIKVLKVIRTLCILPFIVSFAVVVYKLIISGGYVFVNTIPTAAMILSRVWGTIKDIFYLVAKYTTVNGAWILLVSFIVLGVIISVLIKSNRRREKRELRELKEIKTVVAKNKNMDDWDY